MIRIKREGLLFKFAVIFIIFTFITLFMSGFNAYFNQKRSYRRQSEDNIRHIADYLEEMIAADGDDFISLQKYFLQHSEDILIPFDYDGNREPAKNRFETLFAQKHPGRSFGLDIHFEELDEEVKLAYAVYIYEHYLNMFEKAQKDFDIAYAYYLVPSEEPYHMIYMIDAVRENKVVGEKRYIGLGMDVYMAPAKHEAMWDAWEGRENPRGYDVYDNDYGRTYACYTPLTIGGEKIGVIVTEVFIQTVDKAILRSTIKQLISMCGIMIICMMIMLLVINKRYISKIVRLEASVREYASTKDPLTAKYIRENSTGSDELSCLSRRLAEMIVEIEEHMNRLLKTAQELSSTRQRAAEINDLANKDALTETWNKNAYNKEIRRIEWEIRDHCAAFGVAMIDLNFLKRTNDTYGHERGDIAIKKLCGIVRSVFRRSPVYRVGGDEFVVLAEQSDYVNIEALAEEFKRRISELSSDDSLEPWERVSAAIGIARYNPVSDDSVSCVFKRADQSMYENKRAMKAERDK